MALYRCASCGSSNIKTETQVGELKYNYLKGAIGTVVLGMGGAVAGIENKTQQIYICSDCGVALTYSMPDDMKNIIDFCLLNTSARDNISYHGVPMTWSFLKQKYKNIETTEIDRIEEEKIVADETSRLSFAERFDKEYMFNTELKEAGKQLRPLFDEEFQKCIEIQKELNKTMAEEVKEVVLSLTESLNKQNNKLFETNGQLQEVQKEINTKKEYLESLGFFKKAEKIKTKEELQILYDQEFNLEFVVTEIKEEIKKIQEILKNTTQETTDELSHDLIKELAMFALPHLGIVTAFTFLDRLGFDCEEEPPISYRTLTKAFDALVEDRRLLRIIHQRKNYYALPSPDFDTINSSMEINL